MLKQPVQDAINEQINQELFSAYVYLSMSAFFESANLPGMGKWMRAQAQEEVTHAMRLFDFMNDRGCRVILKSIDAPPTEFAGPLQIFEQALEHERHVTSLIHRLYEVAWDAKDLPTQVALQWFITEQVEEEKTADLIVEQLKMIGNDRPALLMLDRELASRQPGDDDD